VRNQAFRNLFRRLGNRVYPSIRPGARQGLYGCLENVGPAGIRGWLLDCAACDAHLKVDVYLDDHLLGSGYADRPRPDLSQTLGLPIACEFLIPWDGTTLSQHLNGLEQNTKLQIRALAADSGQELHAIDDVVRTVQQLNDYAKDNAATSIAHAYIDTEEDEARIATIRTEFSESYYLSQNADVVAADIDLVKHYYHRGWREGRNPNKTFDTRYYLEANEDVHRAGLNPFWHYLVAGRKEERLARRPGGYRRRIIDAARSPEERAKHYAVPAGDLLDGRSLADRIDAALAGAAGLVISLSHDCYIRVIGGTQIFIADEQRRFAERKYAYIHLSPRRARLDLAPIDDACEVQIVIDGEFTGIATIETFITVLGDRLTEIKTPRMFIVHSVLGFNEERIVNLRTALLPTRSVFWLHDYTSLCEGFNLLRDDLAFCHAPPPGSMACRICVYGAGRARHLDRMRRLFEEYDFDVLSPSASTLDLWSQRTALPFASAAVHPHSHLTCQAAEAPTTTRQHADADRLPVRIGFVGFPSPGKGWPIFSALVDDFHADPRYAFIHFAARDVSSIPECEFVVTESTPDDRDATLRLLHEHRIDFLAMMSPWPETFSFVAHEAIAAGCHLLCFSDSGNVAALARRTGLGTVFDDTAAMRSFFAGDEAVAVAREARAHPHRFHLIHSGTTATVKHFFQEHAST
jgi:hypothetical protein